MESFRKTACKTKNFRQSWRQSAPLQDSRSDELPEAVREHSHVFSTGIIITTNMNKYRQYTVLWTDKLYTGVTA